LILKNIFPSEINDVLRKIRTGEKDFVLVSKENRNRFSGGKKRNRFSGGKKGQFILFLFVLNQFFGHFSFILDDYVFDKRKYWQK